MKNLKNIFAALLFATLPIAFTSCDTDPWDDGPYWDYDNYYEGWYDDYDWYGDPFEHGNDELNQMAQTLRGHWTGQIRYYYTNDYGQREHVDMDVDFEFDQYDRNSINGRGREIDYVGNESQELKFSWYIDPRTANINIKYDGSGKTYLLDAHASSHDSGFYLDDDEFSGVMEGINNDEMLIFDCSRTTITRAKGISKARTKSFLEKAMEKDSLNRMFVRRK